MNKLFASVIVFGNLLILPILPLHAQPGFEGTLIWSMAIPSMDKFNVIINIKGEKSEIEMNMGTYGNSKMWVDRANKRNYMMLSTMKNGTVQEMGDLTPPASSSVDIKPTGRTEAIEGYAAEEYVQKNPNGEVSMWVTSGLPKDVQYAFYNWASNSANQDPNQLKVIKDFTDRGLAPVRMTVSIEGKVGMTMEFVKFERKSLPDALFIPPADVKFEELPTGAGSGTH